MKIFLFNFNDFTINKSVLGLKLMVNSGPRQGSRMLGYHTRIKV